MPHPDWEDLGVFFNLAEFATTGVFSRNGAPLGEVVGIYDDPNSPHILGDLTIDNPTPTFLAPEVDLVALDIKRNDTLEVEGQTFDVMEPPQKDGTGVATIILGKPTETYVVPPP